MNSRQIATYNELLEIASNNQCKILSEYYTNATTIMDFECSNGHKRVTSAGQFRSNPNACIKCYREINYVKVNREQFAAAIEKLGGKVIGDYVNCNKKVECICKNNHVCHPSPARIKQGQGMCRKCHSVDVEKRFIDAIEKLGGKVVGIYSCCDKPVHCICQNNHDCYPAPSNILSGCGMCKKCVGMCPIQSAENFQQTIKQLGGAVIGKYVKCTEGVKCVCKNNHICFPRPRDIQQGGGMCKKCANTCPEQAKERFYDRICKLGGTVTGNYTDCWSPVECVCKNNHKCFPCPYRIKNGRDMCVICSKKNYSRMAMEWLKLFEQYIVLQHAENGGEHRVMLDKPAMHWKKWVTIDGYCESLKLCFEYDGCIFHGCDNKCCRGNRLKTNPFNGKSMKDILEKTRSKHELIKSLGYRLIIIKECEYIDMKKSEDMNLYALNILKDECAYMCST